MLWPVQVAQSPKTTWAVGQEFEGYLRWRNAAEPAAAIDLKGVDRSAFNAPGGAIFVDVSDLDVADDRPDSARGHLTGRLVEEGEAVLVPRGLPLSHGGVEVIYAFSELYDRMEGRYVRRAGYARTQTVPTTDWGHALQDDPHQTTTSPVPTSGLTFLSRRQYEERFPERVHAQQWRSGGFVLMIRADGASA